MTMEAMEVAAKSESSEEAAELKPKPEPEPSQEKDMLDHFTDNGGLYDLIVKKMLQPGHEGELCMWLRDLNLIRSNMNCPTETCNGKSLSWTTARAIDKYGWVCNECKKRQSLRDSSFFFQIKCDLKLCMQIIVAWCQSTPNDVVASYLKLKTHIVKKAYEKLGKVAEMYLKKHSEEWILGGEEKVLIVDEFPGGYMTETLTNAPVSKKRNNNCHTILCMAELDKIPPRMWMHIIQANPEPLTSKNAKNPKPENKCGMVEEALNEICAHIRPGSFIIANKRARCCNYESLKELKEYKVISIEDLQLYDEGQNKLLGNLETIWQIGIGICEDIQVTSRVNGLLILYESLWRQRFAATTANAFSSIIQHIVECYPFT